MERYANISHFLPRIGPETQEYAHKAITSGRMYRQSAGAAAKASAELV